RIQSNYMALQRINQELEDKLFRMGQHYEEEKRALSHEIVALNSHLLEAKVTIDKLSEDNALMGQHAGVCSRLSGRSHSAGATGRVPLRPGAPVPARLSLPVWACPSPRPCPGALSWSLGHPPRSSQNRSNGSVPSPTRNQEASAQDLGFPEGLEKPGSRPPYKGDVYCSDTALYCPEARHQDRRPSVEGPGSDVGFLQAQNSTDSTAEEEEEEEEDTEAGAAAYPASYRHRGTPTRASCPPCTTTVQRFLTQQQPSPTEMSILPPCHPLRPQLYQREPPGP
ncbi:hypothetical protein K5549_017498, partial [Capra hircus]